MFLTNHWYFKQVVLHELELKKPQLDELMQTAENLKSESTRHNLHVKGKLINMNLSILHELLEKILLLHIYSHKITGALDGNKYSCAKKEIRIRTMLVRFIPLGISFERIGQLFGRNGEKSGD